MRIRDLFFRRDLLVGPVRQILVDHLQAAARTPSRYALAMSTIESLLDTWPLAAMIDDAMQRWIAGPDAHSLAVMSRCAEVVAPAVGWPLSIDRRWPLPDETWIRESCGEGPFVVIPRGDNDAAPAVAVSLDAPLGEPERLPLPAVLRVQGDHLFERREELTAALRDGRYGAIRFESPVPWDDDSRAALAALQAASPVQLSYQRFGAAALETGPVRPWAELLGTAPAGKPGPRPERVSDAVVLPVLTDEGAMVTMGCLLWDGPYKNVRVIPEAVEVLRRLDGQSTAAEIAAAMSSPVAHAQKIVDDLVRLGAASA